MPTAVGAALLAAFICILATVLLCTRVRGCEFGGMDLVFASVAALCVAAPAHCGAGHRVAVHACSWVWHLYNIERQVRHG